MKTLAIAQQAVTTTPSTAQPVFWRVAWKEFRMLRGFWLAVGGLAVAQQTVSLFVRAPGVDATVMLFASALGAAALYAAGAAAMLFAVEHEERTFSFLSSLPANWLPVFGGKMLVASASAVGLAAALCLTGRLLAGGWPATQDAIAYTGLFGIAILEALTWGTLFSLRLKRPLTAALLAICAASLLVQLLVSLGADSVTPSWMVESYLAAIPERLLVVAAVLVADVLLARRWWPVSSRNPAGRTAGRETGHNGMEPAETATTALLTASVAQSAVGIASETHGPSYPRMVGRLGWQTWRASWRTMLVMLLATGLLSLLALMILLPLADLWNIPGWLLTLGVSLAGSALYGSSVFHADQQRQQYRFLAEHAGRGRIVWFCRLSVWAGGLGLLLLVGWLGCWLYTLVAIEEHASHLARAYAENTYTVYQDLGRTARQWALFHRYAHGIGVASFGIFSGLAIGQFSALMMRRSLVSALLAAVLAAVLFGWSAVVIAWALPWWSCLLPVPLGLFGAAWLRVPDWLVERNNIRGWSQVLAAAGLPVVLVAGWLPFARLGQVPDQSAAQHRMEGLLRQVNDGTTLEARRAGDRLLLLNPRIEPIKLPKQNRAGNSITEAERFAYHRQQVTANRKIITQACEQIARQTCLFPPLCVSGVWQQPFSGLRDLATLVTWAGDMTTAEGQLEQALEYYLTSLRIYSAMRTGQPSNVFIQTAHGINQVERQLAHWAGHPEQTAARIRQALGQLEQIGRLPLTSKSIEPTEADDPAFGLSIDYGHVRDVLDEKVLPRSLGSLDLAYLANKLPFEQTRALRVLAALTAKHLDTLELVRQRLDQRQLSKETLVTKGHEISTRRSVNSNSKQALQLRHWLRNASRQNDYDVLRQLAYLARQTPWSWFSTSYLLRDEYEVTSSPGRLLRTYAQGQVSRLGLQVQLALIAYRIDQGQYPDKLQTLVPKYLPILPIDPFSGDLLAYEPAGLTYPLAVHGGFSQQGNEIAARTPFLWSVGHCYAVLERVAADQSDDIGASADQADQVTLSAQPAYRYRFRPRESQRAYSALVFPLPK